MTSTTILTGKIRPPKAKKQLLKRPRLISFLEESRDYKLILISAGTGFGKTTLLIDFAYSFDIPICWYTLDENDRDPSLFARYFLHSVRQQYPLFGKSFEELLNYNLEQLHQDATIDRLAEEFVADLEKLQDETENFKETILVLDDFQHAESFGVTRFVRRLLDYLPDSFHLVISSRKNPDNLPLIKLIAKQMVSSIGQDDLAFTVEEISQLLVEYYGNDDLELAENLSKFAEGWVTGIVLALGNQSLFKNGKWREVSALNSGGFAMEGIFNYLAQEVFEKLPGDIQDFLIKTSVLETLSPDMCDSLLEYNNSFNSLNYLENQNLFITRMRGDEDTYQLHNLFRQFLLSKLKENSNNLQESQIKAARLQQAKGNNLAAIQLLISAKEFREAATLLNEVVEEFQESGRTYLLNNLLASIPQEEQNKLPHLLNANARMLIEIGENETSLTNYNAAEKLYRQEGLFDHAALALANQSQAFMRMGKRDEAFSLSLQTLRDYTNLMQTRVGQKAVVLAKYVLANISIEKGNNKQAETYLKESAEIVKTENDYFRLTTIEYSFGWLYQNEGRLVKSTIHLERALIYSLKIGNRMHEAYIRNVLSITHYLQGHYLEAERQLIEVLTFIEEANNKYLKLFVLDSLGNVYRETERYSKADLTYSKALELARELRVRTQELIILNDQAFSYILQGQKQEAQRLLVLSLELAKDYDLPEKNALNYYYQGWLEYENKGYKRSLNFFDKALVLSKSLNESAQETRILFVMAIVLLAANEPKKALVSLNQSLELAQELGFEPYLPFEVNRATSLLDYAAQKKVADPTSQFLLRRGFYSNNDKQQMANDLSEEDTNLTALPEPINFSERTNKSNSIVTEAASVSDPSELRICAFDGGKVWKGGIEIKQWRTSKAREALYYLLENDGCTRDQMFDALWPDENMEDSPNLLNSNLSYLRKTITPVELKYSSGRYYLQGNIWYDVKEFTTALNNLPTGKNPDTIKMSKALNIYKRDFLDQLYSNWSMERQRELLQLYLVNSEKMIRCYQQLNDYQAALTLCRQLLLKDPYNEVAYEVSIDCLLKTGNKSEALAQLEKCRKALGELDLEPSELILKKFA